MRRRSACSSAVSFGYWYFQCLSLPQFQQPGYPSLLTLENSLPPLLEPPSSFLFLSPCLPCPPQPLHHVPSSRPSRPGSPRPQPVVLISITPAPCGSRRGLSLALYPPTISIRRSYVHGRLSVLFWTQSCFTSAFSYLCRLLFGPVKARAARYLLAASSIIFACLMGLATS